ncbi:MAG: isoleucyl-tRNA synthetase [Parcubacteria group bacterium Gr01-1014_17]|nr:MAG: isoleucyl-tRNA synthetase [Parcubacteria group bacterium Gr01-1014_17]
MDGNQQKKTVADKEREVLKFWKENKVFEKSLQKESPEGDFVFYDGPPFATGLPHHGSLLSSVIKDVIPRYKTMCGFRVARRWGWDCHGLPIESLVEKRLGLKTKKDIEKIGIATFNNAARASVLEFEKEWEKYVERVGRFVDFGNSYKTMDNSYMESVWWALKQLHEKKLLYEGKKVLMYCPHCETPLAKAEIAMDNTYKEITEEAVTVKFKVKKPEKIGLNGDVYLLAWTTTPWTLPGNVALAVGEKIVYVKVKIENDLFILAKDRLAEVFKGKAYETIEEIKGKKLVGLEYEPIFEVPALKSEKSYKVYAADFVNTEEGTGIVHTAVMYGEDDFALGQKEGLSMVQLLDASAKYNEHAPEFLRGKYVKDAEEEIKSDLETRGLLFARALNTHEYPHCYRCGTPLIYNAVPSWFIAIQKAKKKMLSENEKIQWVPEHLKHGRFKNIVEGAPDWNISRNRFWATPLPIWKEKGGSRVIVVGSLDELKHLVKKSGNQYFIMRHGEAIDNVKNIEDLYGDPQNHLTGNGKAGVVHAAANLKREKIDFIITSPFVRTRETALLVQKELGLPDNAVIVDERLHERNEQTLVEVRRRVGEFLFEIESRYQNKRILIVGHGGPLWVLSQVAEGKPSNQFSDRVMLGLAETLVLQFALFPHNQDYELDLHRPWIDTLTLVDEAGREYERIPEVVDCWVESAAMPFASKPAKYPADFIAEYIAQTRTWFYYLHALGILLSNRRAFNAVVSTGTILAEDGAKISKSKGNYTDPFLLMDQYGADAFRLCLMGSVVMQGEDLSFRDDDVREAHNRVVGILRNCLSFFELYKDKYNGKTHAEESMHILDVWIRARLARAVQTITNAMEVYDTPSACREIRAFTEDYSTWYIRRSRARVKSENEQDKQYALATQREVLLSLSKLIAPIMPFLAEEMYQSIFTAPDVGGFKHLVPILSVPSVHLESWPDTGNWKLETGVLEKMEEVRKIVSLALEARAKANIKIRQPLQKLKIKKLEIHTEFLLLIQEEVNIKEVIFDKTLAGEVELDTTITQELKEEGNFRELVRAVQNLRKKKGLTISDLATLIVDTSADGKAFVEKFIGELKKSALLKDVQFVSIAVGETTSICGDLYKFDIKV